MKLSAHEMVAGYGKLSVLHGVDLEINDGELVAVLGPNGAGKTTLMRALARTIPVMSGRLELDGAPIAGWRPYQAAKAGIGYVPQEENVFADLSVRENLNLSASGKPPADILEQIYERFPILKERADQTAGSLSGGERQALAVSMAVLGRPRLLLLDEPTSGLSPLASQALTRWIVDIAATGVSILWIVEQNPEPVLAAAARAYVLAAGSVVYTGPASDITGDEALSLALD
ncbi:MAG: ABC transporter ATP-binding protein [Actinomycetota bacterium]|nr:ABC transporter ATP-binding protein [Actinomycetota bacterium]